MCNPHNKRYVSSNIYYGRPSILGQLSASRSESASHISIIDRGGVSHVFILVMTLYFDYRQGRSKPCVHFSHDFLRQALEDNIIFCVFPCGHLRFVKQAFIVINGYASHFFSILSGDTILQIEVAHHCSTMSLPLGLEEFLCGFVLYSNPWSHASLVRGVLVWSWQLASRSKYMMGIFVGVVLVILVPAQPSDSFLQHPNFQS